MVLERTTDARDTGHATLALHWPARCLASWCAQHNKRYMRKWRSSPEAFITGSSLVQRSMCVWHLRLHAA